MWATRLGIAAVVAFVVGPVLAHLGVLPPRVGFLLFGLGGLLGIVAAVLGIIGALRGGGVSAGLVVGALVAAIFLVFAVPAGKVPPINDITTDTSTPPQFVAAGSIEANRGRDMKYPGPSFAEQQRGGYPDLAPLQLAASPDEVYARVEVVAKQMPTWQITRTDAAAHALEGVDTTQLFQFKDDFVIEVRPQNSGSLVQMRSKSRDGKGDVGANAARIRAFFEKLK
jgi:uncharacterized protein (DUF1499 family)